MAEKRYLKRNWDAMADVCEGPLHLKLAKRLRKCFHELNKVGSTIYNHRKSQKPKRTWKDSNEITMYLSELVYSHVNET